MSNVHLNAAWYWDCPRCRRRNFAEAVPAELTAAEIDADREGLAYLLRTEPWKVPPNVSEDLVTLPDSVECKLCGEEYGIAPDVNPR